MDQCLVARLQDYFARQIAHCEELIEFFDAKLDAMDREELDDLVEDQERCMARTRELEAEFAALIREWERAKGITAADRAALRPLAIRAEQLTTQLSDRFASAGHKARNRMKPLKEELDSMRRCRVNVRRFRMEYPEPGHLDTRA